MKSIHRQEAGRKRLAMRLPKLRERIVKTTDPLQLELFEAYQLAVETRERLRFDPANVALFSDYSELCINIEADVVRAEYPVSRRGG